METLFTPWRYSYIVRSAQEPECFFCAAAREPDEADRLVVHMARHHLVMLNLHPYSSGHLMVAPLEHQSTPFESAEEACAEFWPLVLKTQRVLAKAYTPDGFNLGMNLGALGGGGSARAFPFPRGAALGR